MKKKKNKVYQIYVSYETITLHSQSSNEPYGEWSRELLTTATHISKENERSSEEMTISFKPKESVFLIQGIYSEGDSFGTETGCSEFGEILETKEEAEDMVRLIGLFDELETNDGYGLTKKQKEHKISNLEYQLKNNIIENKSWGRKYNFIKGGKTYHFPWGGYFERLSHLEVVELKYEEN